MTSLDGLKIREDFAFFSDKNRLKTSVYLDSSATSLKPTHVVDVVSDYYLHRSSNIKRGVHSLAHSVNESYEDVRSKVKKFINADYDDEIIFVPNSTYGINLVALGLTKIFFKKNDYVLLSDREHHSNLAPWLMMRDTVGVDILKTLDINNLLDNLTVMLKSNRAIKMLSINYVSNVDGIILDIPSIVNSAKNSGVELILVDAAQAASHIKIDVKQLGCDFLVFSGHKMFAPDGVGVLYVKRSAQKFLYPVLTGSGGVVSVTDNNTVVLNSFPSVFELGTSPVGSVLGLGAAVDYINEVGFDSIREHDKELMRYLLTDLSKLDFVEVVNKENMDAVGIVSFNLRGVHSHDVATLLDDEGVAVRSGFLCCEPFFKYRGLDSGAVRASLSIYNTKDDVVALVNSLKKIKELFA